jgi:hypothetical protein
MRNRKIGRQRLRWRCWRLVGCGCGGGGGEKEVDAAQKKRLQQFLKTRLEYEPKLSIIDGTNLHMLFTIFKNSFWLSKSSPFLPPLAKIIICAFCRRPVAAKQMPRHGVFSRGEMGHLFLANDDAEKIARQIALNYEHENTFRLCNADATVTFTMLTLRQPCARSDGEGK